MEQQEGSLAASPNLVSASEVTQHEVCEDTHWVPVDGSKRNHLPPVCPILLKVMATVCVHWAGAGGGGGGGLRVVVVVVWGGGLQFPAAVRLSRTPRVYSGMIWLHCIYR